MFVVDHDVWLIDPTPGRMRSQPGAARGSELAGRAGCGCCTSHSRLFCGLRLHLVCTPDGLPIMWSLANPKVDEREVARDSFEIDAALVAARPGQKLIADKGHAGPARSLLAHDH